jgi:hypothetical protein
MIHHLPDPSVWDLIGGGLISLAAVGICWRFLGWPHADDSDTARRQP